MKNASRAAPRRRNSFLHIACRGVLIAAVAATAAAGSALAQPAPDAARQRYEEALARCNAGDLPAPERNACVRDAGLAMDRARGSAAPDSTVDSRDGRAVIVTPDSIPAPRRGGDDGDVTTDDGRAVIVLPDDNTR